MALVQKVLLAIMPRELAKAMEQESRLWMMRCPDGHETSVWAAGGIRYKARGEPIRVVVCSTCKRPRKMRLFKRAP